MQYESPVGGADTSSYVDPDPGLGTDGSRVRAPAIENVMRELDHLISFAGITPARGDLQQVRKAIQALLGSGSRPALFAARDYYVSPSGSDSSDGLSVGAPFATFDKFFETVADLDIGDNEVRCNAADGTYTQTVTCAKVWNGSGKVRLVGNTSSPGNCVMNGAGVIVQDRSRLYIGGFRFAGSGHGLLSQRDGFVVLDGNNDFAALGSGKYQLYATQGGQIHVDANYSISGGADFHWAADFDSLLACFGRAITLAGTPAFSQAFAYARAGTLEVQSNTFPGTGATGPEYIVSLNGQINTFGAGAGYLPGSSGGITSSGGQYE